MLMLFTRKLFQPSRLLCSLFLATGSMIVVPVYAQTGGGTDSLNKHKADVQQVAGVIAGSRIQPGTDKNGAQLLKRLNGVLVLPHPNTQNYLQGLTISGMGERYNQVLLNGAVFNSFEPMGRVYPFALLPAEAIEAVSVQKIADPSTPADVAGGTVSIRTKDLPTQPFHYLQIGAGFSDATNGKDFYSDPRNNLEWLSVAGSKRKLPGAFPTTRSQSFFNQKNTQEQVYLSKLLNNNLGPVNQGHARLNDRVLLGFGKTYKLKKGEQIGLVAFINHEQSERIDEATVQVAPVVPGNLFPFTTGKPLIRSMSQDKNYRSAAQLTAIVNAAILFGKNKISLKNFLGNQLLNTFTQRTGLLKPDEDTLAHTGINYTTTQRQFISTQLNGEHLLGKDNNFTMNWEAAYTWYKQQNPDERNFLLKEGGNNTFEIAQQSTASLSSSDAMFTNTSRSWRKFTDHQFTGAIHLKVAFDIARQPQVLTGGVYLQSINRTFVSDLLLVQGNGFYSLDNILAPERYYPGGLSVQNYYVRTDRNNNNGIILPVNRANYTGSANTGASYINLESRLTKSLLLNWGLRVESNSQLVSNTQYEYAEGFKNPQLFTIDENARVIKLDVLPAVRLNYQVARQLKLHAAWFKTVNRPQLQELTLYRYYDAASFMVRTGNPLLASSNLHHYNAGISYSANSHASIEVAAFYKKIDQPIEYVLSNYANATGNLLVVPHNTPSATVRGIEASLNLDLGVFGAAPWLSNISFNAGGNWLRSTADGGPVKSTATPNVVEHTLSGTPDYTINAALIVQQPKFPQVSLLYNRTGDYISVVGSGASWSLPNGNKVLTMPHYRVKGMDLFDLQLSQQFCKSRLQLIVGAHNLFNTAYIEYQDLNGNKKFDDPLTLTTQTGNGAFYKSGTDNTVTHVQPQRTYYLRLSYLFK